jgi:hypothetical protein
VPITIFFQWNTKFCSWQISLIFSQFQTWPFYPIFGLPTSTYQIPVKKSNNHSFVTRVISDFGTAKQGSGPQKLDLDPSPTKPSASSFPIIPQWPGTQNNWTQLWIESPCREFRHCSTSFDDTVSNSTQIKRPDCPSKCRPFYKSCTPSNSSRYKPKWRKLQSER